MLWFLLNPQSICSQLKVCVCVWEGGGGVSDLKKKKRLENWPDFLFLHRVAVVVIGGTFSGGPK